jgi:hypothetical protein
MATKDFRIAAQSRETDGLKRQLEAVQPSNKRPPVNCNPQEQFADIKAIKEAQDEYAAAEAAKALRAARYQHQNQFYKIMANNKKEHNANFESICPMFSFDDVCM